MPHIPFAFADTPLVGSMVTDSQRLGMISGHFIRAQRLCSVLETFKEAVQNVVLARCAEGTNEGS